jgi:hypothetical protein
VGQQGPQGPPGAAATSLWAVVGSGGDLLLGKGVVSTSRLKTGVYIVEFNQDVTQFALLATPFLKPLTGGEVAVAPTFDNANAVAVYTYDSTGAAIDNLFSLVLFG